MERLIAGSVAGRRLTSTAAGRWDDEYRAGRYVDEPAVEFTEVIGAAARELSSVDGVGLYIGCGNGRNYVPLVEQYQLDLLGLDISAAAIDQLRARMPERADRLVHGTIAMLEPGSKFTIVIAIQVFQHGTEAEARAHFTAASELLLPGGLFCVRVNAASSELEHRHQVVERNEQGGFTVRYEDGPKEGLFVHFFGRTEIEALTANLTPAWPLRCHRTQRPPPRRGHWDQWEGIWISN